MSDLLSCVRLLVQSDMFVRVIFMNRPNLTNRIQTKMYIFTKKKFDKYDVKLQSTFIPFIRNLIFMETCSIVVNLESFMFVRVIFINKPNLTNMLYEKQNYIFTKKTNLTNMMSYFKAYFSYN